MDFFDIGANSGMCSAFVAEASLSGSRVFVVEPNPVMMDRARVNLALNGLDDLATFLPVTVSDVGGDVSLFIHDANYGQSSLLHNTDRSRAITVPSLSLKDLFERRVKARPLVVKMDIEGFEAEVFRSYLDVIDVAEMPGFLLIEVAGMSDWSFNLLGTLKGVGYAEDFRGEGNIIFQKSE